MALIENPLKSEFGTLPDFITAILGIVVQIGAPIAVLFIIYSGFLFVTARGNETQLTKAKTTFTWTIIGAAILLGASVLATVIQGTITELGVGLS